MFVDGKKPEVTERCTQITWQVVHLKLGTKVGITKPSTRKNNICSMCFVFLLIQ
ncbi:hypothetical protein HanPSC8_Chr09g0360201 [Helianthus annuus]|nr:hypothetical protein HanPSC8_Chr09g0360201 [Helianthus annuus]